MALRGTYSSISRRLAEAEAQAAAIPGSGCATCSDWPAYPVTGGEPPIAPQGWPTSWRCPDCGRAPVVRFRIEYIDRPLTSAKGAWPWSD